MVGAPLKKFPMAVYDREPRRSNDTLLHVELKKDAPVELINMLTLKELNQQWPRFSSRRRRHHHPIFLSA
jgi:hypothetical protein